MSLVGHDPPFRACKIPTFKRLKPSCKCRSMTAWNLQQRPLRPVQHCAGRPRRAADRDIHQFETRLVPFDLLPSIPLPPIAIAHLLLRQSSFEHRLGPSKRRLHLLDFFLR